MNIKKSTLTTAIVAALGGISMDVQAALTASATLSFNAGTAICTSGPLTGCLPGATDIGGSYFAMDADGSGSVETGDKVAISMFAPIHLGTLQQSSGQHTGLANGSETPAIDNPWNFYANTGMHTLNSPVSLISDLGGGVMTLNFSGWGVNWANYGPGGSRPTIPMGGTATITCSSVLCSNTDTYVLDMAVHIPMGFTSAPYTLHLEGSIASTDVSPVPVPAAAWLFGSGLVGLVGVARRRRS